MRKKILGFVFAAAVLAAMTVPLFGAAGAAQASPSWVPTPNGECHQIGHVGGHFEGHSMPPQARFGVGPIVHQTTCP